MTRIIAFTSVLLLLPLLHWNALGEGQETVSAHDAAIAIFVFLPLMFTAGHAIWLTCRVFNFVMRKLDTGE